MPAVEMTYRHPEGECENAGRVITILVRTDTPDGWTATAPRPICISCGMEPELLAAPV